MHTSQNVLAALTAVTLLAASLPARAQAHHSTSGPCSLRSDTVDSRSIAASVAAERNLSRASDVAIVDVVVSCKGRPGNGTVAADIDVTRADLQGTTEPIEMHVDHKNGYVSYYGTYRYLPGQVVRIAIRATPEGTSHRMTLSYRHRFAAR